MYNYFSFTLSEVLITLVIVGVVAAITVPLIVADVQKQQTISKLKKVYSTLSQVILRSQNDNGPVDEWYSKEDNNYAADYYSNYYKPYLNGPVKCLGYRECGYDKINPFYYVNGFNYGLHMGTGQTRFNFYMADGVFVIVFTGNYRDSEVAPFETPWIIIDLNGGKKPNRFGRDVFFFDIDKNKGAVPKCNKQTKKQVKEECSDKGFCCFKQIINDNWEIKSDYPW